MNNTKRYNSYLKQQEIFDESVINKVTNIDDQMEQIRNKIQSLQKKLDELADSRRLNLKREFPPFSEFEARALEQQISQKKTEDLPDLSHLDEETAKFVENSLRQKGLIR